MGSSWWGMESNMSKWVGDVRLGAGYRVGVTFGGCLEALLQATCTV